MSYEQHLSPRGSLLIACGGRSPRPILYSLHFLMFPLYNKSLHRRNLRAAHLHLTCILGPPSISTFSSIYDPYFRLTLVSGSGNNPLFSWPTLHGLVGPTSALDTVGSIESARVETADKHHGPQSYAQASNRDDYSGYIRAAALMATVPNALTAQRSA